MPVKVIDKTAQAETEVSSSEAQAGLLDGRYALPAGKVKVRTRDNRTGSVSADQLPTALAEGWQLADEEEVAESTILRQESDIASQAIGGVESVLAGATLGLSTAVEAGLGVDEDRMRARREGLGRVGTALEIGGAIAPTLLTGGAGAGASGARGLAALTPAGALARGGAAVERGLARALPQAPGLVRTAVPVAGRGMVEGFAAGVGAEVDESVLGEREITAERLLQAGGLGALLGGGTGAVIPGIAAAGAGLGKVSVKPIREVLGRAMGTSGDDAGVNLIARLASDDGLQRKAAALWNVDPADVKATFGSLRTREEAAELLDMMQNASGHTERIAGELRSPFEALRNARAKVRTEFGGAQKIRHVERNLPKETDRLVIAQERGIQALDELDGAASRAQEGLTPGAINPGDMRTVRRLVQDARDVINAARENANGKSGARTVAAVTHRELDKVKQALFTLKDRHRRITSSGAPTLDSQDTLAFFDGPDGVYKRLAASLEDEQTWGAAGLAQQEINRRSAEAIAGRRLLKGSASGRLLDPSRPVVDNADLLAVAKQAGGRFSGATKTELLEDAIAAETAYFEAAAKHLDLAPTTKAAIAEYRAAIKQVDEAFAKQRNKVAKLDAAERIRVMETNRSPTSSIFSGAGTTLLGLTGLSLAGPLGAVVGAAAGVATRPSTLLRKLAAIQARTGGAASAQQKAIGGFLRSIGEGTVSAAESVGRGAARATPQASTRGARPDAQAVSKQTRKLAADPELLGQQIRRMTTSLEDAAPQLSSTLAAKASQAISFLAAKAPKGYQAAYSNREPIVDPVAQQEYERYVEAVVEPMRSMERLSDGTFTAEHAEALRTVWPAVYRDLQTQVFGEIAKAHQAGREIPLQVATTMSVLFNAPADPTLPLAPSIMASTISAAAAEQQMASGAPQRTRKVDFHANSFATPAQSIGSTADL